MKFLIEVDKKKTNVTDIYRKVLSKKAKAVELIKDNNDIIIAEVWFDNQELFEVLVNIVFDVDFNRVVLINNDGDIKEEIPKEENDISKIGSAPEIKVELVEDTQPVVGNLPKEDNVPAAEEILAGKERISPEEIVGNDTAATDNRVEEETDKNNGAKVEETLFADVLKPNEGTGHANGKKDEVPKEKKSGKPGLKPGSKQRKREGAELSNLFVIPEFPKELTLENIVNFFEPMKDRVREAVTDVVNVAIDTAYECGMDWKDVVKVSEKKGKYLSDYDKTLSAKRIADVFEQHGYSIRFRAFLQLLRAHVEGKVSLKEEPKKVEQKKNQVVTLSEKTQNLVNFTAFNFLASLNVSDYSKEDIATKIMRAMDYETLSSDARVRFYYMLISVMSVKEYKPEGIVLLLEDIANDAGKEVPKFKVELENEMNNFVKQFTEKNGSTMTMKGFFTLVNEYFRDTFFESDLEFIHKIKSFEQSFGFIKITPKLESKDEHFRKKRFKLLNYPEELEAIYEKQWNDGAGLDEILICIFNTMAGEEMSELHIQYLTICAEAICFDDLNSVYIDMGVSMTQAKVIQGELATILEDYTTSNNLPDIRLYDFLKEIRAVFEEEA